MTTITTARNAKCGDCKFCKSFYDKNRKRHTCTNEKSDRFTSVITLKDLVCDKWVMYGLG